MSRQLSWRLVNLHFQLVLVGCYVLFLGKFANLCGGVDDCKCLVRLTLKHDAFSFEHYHCFSHTNPHMMSLKVWFKYSDLLVHLFLLHNTLALTHTCVVWRQIGPGCFGGDVTQMSFNQGRPCPGQICGPSS